MENAEILDVSALGRYIPAERLKKVFIFNKIDSTNMELNRRIHAGAEGVEDGTVVIALEQTAGLGRMGRSFDSPKDRGLYFSYLFRPEKRVELKAAEKKDALIWASITSWSAVAVSDAIERTCGLRPKIKWVNDLLINKRKICGILTGLITHPQTKEVEGIVIGIGINIREDYEDFPEAYRERTGSLWTETGTIVSRALLAANLIDTMDEMVSLWPDGRARYYEAYLKDSLVLGKKVRLIEGGKEEVVDVVGIDEDFALIVKGPDNNKRRILSGEVTLREMFCGIIPG